MITRFSESGLLVYLVARVVIAMQAEGGSFRLSLFSTITSGGRIVF